MDFNHALVQDEYVRTEGKLSFGRILRKANARLLPFSRRMKLTNKNAGITTPFSCAGGVNDAALREFKSIKYLCQKSIVISVKKVAFTKAIIPERTFFSNDYLMSCRRS